MVWSHCEEWNKVNYELWLPVLRCVTGVGPWSPNLSAGASKTWSAQSQESNTQTDVIWRHETKVDLAPLSYRAWSTKASREVGSGMKQQQRFTFFRPCLKLDSDWHLSLMDLVKAAIYFKLRDCSYIYQHIFWDWNIDLKKCLKFIVYILQVGSFIVG